MSSRFGISAPRTCFLLAAAIGLVMLASGDAAAGDAKRVPGTICDFQDRSVFRPSGSVNGGFRNQSGAPRRVACPIVREQLSETIKVYVRVDNLVDPADCEVVKYAGRTAVVFDNPTILAYGDGTRDLEFEDPMGGNPADVFVVECELENTHSIYAIQWTEP